MMIHLLILLINYYLHWIGEEAFPREIRHWLCSNNRSDSHVYSKTFASLAEVAQLEGRAPYPDEVLHQVLGHFQKGPVKEVQEIIAVADGGKI